MTTRVIIEKATATYSQALNGLNDQVSALNAQIDAVKKQHLAGIKSSVKQVKNLESKLTEQIQGCDGCFVKPQSLIFSGIKVGYRKKKGSIKVSKNTVELIKSKLTDQKQTLISITETVSKTAAAKLSIGEAKKVGIEVVADSNVVVIRAMDSNVDKLVKQLLADDEVLL